MGYMIRHATYMPPYILPYMGIRGVECTHTNTYSGGVVSVLVGIKDPYGRISSTLIPIIPLHRIPYYGWSVVCRDIRDCGL